MSDININSAELASKQHDYVVEMRRHFHRHPELSFREFKTAERIRSELDSDGIEWVKASENGTVGIIHGNGQDPENILCLRADIDALEIDEKSGISFEHKVRIHLHSCS